MKSNWLVPAIIGGVIVVLGLGYINIGNQMVALDEGVKAQKSQVENVYQRRADLIPNLVSTVKGYAKHESQVLIEVTQARAGVGQVKLNSEADMKNFEAAQGKLSGALSRLMVVVEKYPELKANQNFMQLQSQLEGTENRITIERQRYNETVRDFNTYIRKFPGSMLAAGRGFKPLEQFSAKAGSDVAPKVEF